MEGQWIWGRGLVGEGTWRSGGGEFMLKMCCMKEYCPIEVLGFLVFYFMFIGRQDLY